MANGDDVDTEDQVPSPTPVTSGQEKEVNKELFGGQKPADMPTQQREANQDLSKDDSPNPLLEETMKQAEASRKRADEAQKTFETIQGNINRLNEELTNYKPPTPPQLRPYPQYPGLMGGQQPGQGQGQPTTEQQDKGRNLGQIMMQAATLIAIGSAIFGRHRNPYSQIVQQSALGGFFSGLAQGRKDIASEQLQNYNKAVEMTDKLNKEDIEDYKNAVTNNRLTMADQHLMLSDIAAARSDVRMYNAAANHNFTEMIKIMEDQRKARSAWVKAHLDIVTRAENKWLESTEGLSWSQMVKKKFGINPYQSHDKLLEAFDKYPISQWQADKKASGSVDTEEEKSSSAAGGGGSGKSKADPVKLQGSSDEELNREFEQLPQGAFYTGPDGVTRQK